MSYELLLQRSAAFQAENPIDDGPWLGSSFNWIRNRAAPTKGKIGRDFAMSLIEAAGLPVNKSGMRLEVNEKVLRVKLSLMGEAGTLMFEQIKNDDFDYLICVGLVPDNAYGWLIPKDEMLVDGVLQERQGLSGQHIGDTDASDFWITDLNPAQPFSWLLPFGGTIERLTQILRKRLS